MKIGRLLYLSISVGVLAGCVNNVTYDLSSFITPDGKTVLDSRQVKRPKTVGVGSLKHALYIGDEQIVPNPSRLVGSKIGLINQNKFGNQIGLKEFEIILWFPRHRAVLAGASLAGAAYALGPLGESMFSNEQFNEDGVISRISLDISGRTYRCSAFVEDYDAIGALFGPRVSGAELQPVINKAVDKCLRNLQP